MLSRFLSFDKLLGPSMITVFYFLGMAVIVIGSVLGALGMLFNGFQIFAALGSLIGGLIGLIFWRFLCEIYLLFFRMSDDLRDIKNHQLGLTKNETDVNIGQ